MTLQYSRFWLALRVLFHPHGLMLLRDVDYRSGGRQEKVETIVLLPGYSPPMEKARGAR